MSGLYRGSPHTPSRSPRLICGSRSIDVSLDIAVDLELPGRVRGLCSRRERRAISAGEREHEQVQREARTGKRRRWRPRGIPIRGRAARRRQGVARQTPRAAHGGWKPPEDRRDPVEVLREANEGRIAELIPLRFFRMAQSPFAFYRGAAAIMAADLACTPTSGLRVQACGDAHLMNFGGFATPERNIFFDINDFDETLPAPWEWDVKRLAASIVIAARHINLPDSAGANAATESVCSYRERMADYASMRALDVWYDRIDLDRVLKVLPSGAEVERGEAKSRAGAAEEFA